MIRFFMYAVKSLIYIYILYVSMVSRWSMKTETTVLRRFILTFPGGSDIQISQDTEVENSAG